LTVGRTTGPLTQLGDKENKMPPKRKQKVNELRKALREKDAKMKALEAQLASVQAANENKCGTSPTEQVRMPKKSSKQELIKAVNQPVLTKMMTLSRKRRK